ncbi:antitermination protein, partial [Salmonella enterica subsp. enterica]|nr:antitermination protein [Salmonella enterica subsp. enterica]
VRPSDWEKWTEVTEIVPAVCEACDGKGAISARCRCGGKGEVLDRKATSERGTPVFKTCERCSGEGYSRVSSATVHRAILKRLPELHQSSWSRNWKPFYEMLVNELHKGECQATVEFEKVTS